MKPQYMHVKVSNLVYISLLKSIQCNIKKYRKLRSPYVSFNRFVFYMLCLSVILFYLKKYIYKRKKNGINDEYIIIYFIKTSQTWRWAAIDMMTEMYTAFTFAGTFKSILWVRTKP